MAKNILSLQLLRNTTIYSTKAAALDALTGTTAPPQGTQDGTPVLARYLGEGNKIMTIVGYWAAAADGGNAHMTVFDLEGSEADVEALREEINAKLGDGIGSGETETVTAQLTALSGTNADTSATTSVAGAKAYTDDKVAEELGALDYTLAKDDNKVVVSFEQTDGKISGVSENITGVKLAGYQEGLDADIAATDTLGEALGKLQAQINAMDLEVVSGDGEVITAVSEADGKVIAEKTAIKDVKLTGYVKDASKTGALVATDDIEDALSKLENNIAASQSATTLSAADKSINVVTAETGTTVALNIRSGEKVLSLDTDATSGGVYTDIKLSAVTVSEANVKEAFGLIATDGSQLGSTIKIYKDSSLYRAYLGHVDDTITSANDPTVVPGTGDTALCFIYLKTDGTYELVAVNVEEFIEENEFASGVTWDNVAKKVKGVVDSTSETFLTVGADGFKLSGVQNAIDTAISGLDASVSAETTHITVKVDEVDGKLTAVTLTEDGIANATDLAGLSAKTVTEIASSNSSITVASAATTADDGTVKYDVITDASKIKMSGFTADASGFTAISESSSVTEAFKAVETFVLDNEQVTSSALNDLNTRLSAETAARKAVDGQNGDTYAANDDVPYISAATSLNNADIILANAISELSGGYIAGVKVNGVGLAETDNVVNIQISAVNEAANSANAIVANTDNSTGAVTLQLGTIDAGTY